MINTLQKYNELAKFKDSLEFDDDYYISDHVFIVPKDVIWSEICKFTKSNKIDPKTDKKYNLGQLIDMAFIKIEKLNHPPKNILPKTYSKNDLNKNVLGELVVFFTNELKLEDVDGDFFWSNLRILYWNFYQSL